MRRWVFALSLLLICGTAFAREPPTFQVDEIKHPFFFFLPDGKSIVGSCRDHSLVLYDETGRLIAGHARISYDLWALAVDPTGRRIATAEQVLKGKTLTSGTASRIRLWLLPELKVERTIDVDRMPTALTFSPDGKLLASAHSEVEVAIWDAETGQKQHAWSAKDRDITTLVFSTDGKRLACAGNAAQLTQQAFTFMGSDQVTIVDAATGGNVEKLEINASWLVTSADRRWFHHQGSWHQKVAAGKGALTVDGQSYTFRHEVGLIDQFNGRTVYRSENGPGPIVIAAHGPFMSYSRKDPFDSMSAVERAKLKETRPPWQHRRVAELRTGRDIWTRADPDVTAAALSPDGRRLAVARGPTVPMRGAGKSSSVEVFDLLPDPGASEKLMGIAAAWKELADPNSDKLLEAYRALRTDANDTLQFLRNEIRPATLDEKLLAQRTEELNDPQFSKRERAAAELMKMDAEGWLIKAVRKSASAEQRQRIEKLLKWFSAQELQSKRLQVARALDLMTFMPREKAAPFLDDLVKNGNSDAWLTREAKIARRKLNR